MSEVSDDAALRELRLQKRNAYMALNEATAKSTGNLETLRGLKGDHDKKIEGWEIHIELLNLKWQKNSCYKGKEKINPGWHG